MLFRFLIGKLIRDFFILAKGILLKLNRTDIQGCNTTESFFHALRKPLKLLAHLFILTQFNKVISLRKPLVYRTCLNP
jgi:hypothetical protein